MASTKEIKRRIKSCANITPPVTPLTFTQKLKQEVLHDLTPSRETIDQAIGQQIAKFIFIKF